MKGTKIRNRILALILALVMVISIVTVSASAATADNNNTTTEQKYTTKLDDPIDIYENVIIENDGTGEITEVVSLRQENAKHFKMPDGTFQAVYYATPVHRKDASGTWQDIDNSLTLKSDSTVFSTSDNRMNFAERFVPNESLFTLNENGYSVSMTLMENTISSGSLATMSATDTATLAPKASVTNAPQRQTRWESIDDAVAINNNGIIKYNSIRQSTDLEYVLVGNDIKENIIINAPLESYVYNFKLDVSGLQATLEAKGNVSLQDIETGKTKYRIPAPYMFDASGVISYDVSYGLVELPNGSYVLTVTADTEWINDSARTFPVTIDPTLHPVSDSYDTFVYSGDPTENYGTELEMYINPNTQAYVYIDLYDLPEGAVIYFAELYAYYYLSSGSVGQSITINAYEIASSWDETSVTWDNKPTLSDTALSTETISYSTAVTVNSPSITSFYITDAVEGWLNGTSENNGIALVSSPGSNLTAHLKTYESGTMYMPSIAIFYEHFFEGVYGIENVLWDNQYMTASGTSAIPNTIVKGASFSDSTFATEFRPLSLFKITNVRETEQYIIRSMYDNSLGLCISNGKLAFKSIPLVDTDVPNADTFIIQWDGRGYQIIPYGTTDLLYLSGAGLNVTTKPQSEITSAARWAFREYTGTAYGCAMISAPTSAVVGETVIFKPRTWSTSLASTPHMYVADGYENLATGIWDSSSNSFSLKINNPGKIQLVVAIRSGIYDYYTRTIEVLGVLKTGEYYFLNKESDKLLQLNSDQNMSANGTIFRPGMFNGAWYQKLLISHESNGNYYILYTTTAKAMTFSPYSQPFNVFQSDWDEGEDQLWQINMSESNNYVIKPKTASNSSNFCVLMNLFAECASYTNNDDYLDEWSLISTEIVDATLVIISDPLHSESHDVNLESIIDLLVSAGYSEMRIVTSVTNSECLIYMSTSKLFFFRGHGFWEGIVISEDKERTVECYEVDYLVSNALSNCELAVFSACSTGSGEENADNFVNSVYSKGAKSVLGFNQDMVCVELSAWEIPFFVALVEGTSISTAASAPISYDVDHSGEIDSWEVGISIMYKVYICGSNEPLF